MGAMKTPGVYIVEKNAFPNSVVEVATAVPAFIGHTEIADNKGKPLLNKPKRITSMAEYHTHFGGAPAQVFTLTAKTDKVAILPEQKTFALAGKQYCLIPGGKDYLLYNSMMLFFQNGGGPCYVVSVGDYGTPVAPDKLQAGVDTLIKEQEPTMVVIPEAVRLGSGDCAAVQQHSLMHCGDVMKSRFAILDVFDGYKEEEECIPQFRDAIGKNFLNFSAAYYPWVNAAVVLETDLNGKYFAPESKDLLVKILQPDLDYPGFPAAATPAKDKKDVAPKDKAKADIVAGLLALFDEKSTPDAETISTLHNNLIALSPTYKSLIDDMRYQLNLLPPSGAMAGLYTMVDNNRGVWKAPANVSINSVVSPAVTISSQQQENLNVDIMGKSINAIRTFIGEGTLVWGARTLDGNSLDWRYINVRRTMIMLEESLRLACKAYVFDPNTANTWATINSMIRNFLTGIWKRGGLAGASPDDAFVVKVGLGETMTPEDILEGILRVTVLVAITRPAEFIEITFQQQMQKS